LNLRATYGDISIFENLETVSKPYVATTSIAIVGDQSLLTPLANALPSFGNYSFVFPEVNSPNIRQMLVNLSSLTIVNDPIESSSMGLALPPDRTTFLPTTFLTQSPLSQFWTTTAYGKGDIGWPL